MAVAALDRLGLEPPVVDRLGINQMVPQVGPQSFQENWKGGFFCPCHKSKFDMSGRVYKGVPAPTNLKIPPYSYIDNRTLVLGVIQEGVT